MIALAARYWYIIAIATLVALLGVQQSRVDRAKTATAEARAALASDRATYAQAAQLAEAQARAEENRREADKQEAINAARKQTEAANAAARASDLAAVGLRKQLATYIAAVRSATKDSSIASRSPPTDNALDLLSYLFSRADETAGELAESLDRSRIAGQTCVAAYESLTAKRAPIPTE